MNVNKENVLELVLIAVIAMVATNVIVQLVTKVIPLFLALTSTNVLLMIPVTIRKKYALILQDPIYVIA